jgi:hypothetical protein
MDITSKHACIMRMRPPFSDEHLLHKVDVHEGPVEQALAQVLHEHCLRLPVLELPGHVVNPKIHSCSACSTECVIRVSALCVSRSSLQLLSMTMVMYAEQHHSWRCNMFARGMDALQATPGDDSGRERGVRAAAHAPLGSRNQARSSMPGVLMPNQLSSQATSANASSSLRQDAARVYTAPHKSGPLDVSMPVAQAWSTKLQM